MNSEFEEFLSRKAFRPIPPDWRDEILRAAEAGRPAAAAAASWWREWLWPCPRAWAGLAYAWAVIILLHSIAPSESQPAAAVAPGIWQNLARVQREVEMIAQLPDWPPPEPAVTQPRACSKLKQNIG